MRCGAALVSCALCVASILGGAWMSRPTPVDYGPVLATASDMYAVTDAARKQAKAAQQQQSQHSKASLVDDTMSMSAGDVMNYAGGLTSAIGGGGKSDSSKSAGSGTNDSAKSSDTGDSGNGKASDASDSGNNLDTAPVLFGFGTGGTLFKHDMNALINETVKISDAGTLLAQAVAQLDSPNTQQKTAETRYLIVIPTV